jgi:hypothetical protein
MTRQVGAYFDLVVRCKVLRPHFIVHMPVVGTALGSVLNSEPVESLFCEKLVCKRKLDVLCLEHGQQVNHILKASCSARKRYSLKQTRALSKLLGNSATR